MPSTSQLARKELARRTYLSRDLMAFVQEMEGPSYKAGWVHRDICARLEKFCEDVIAEKSPRLMLLMPPRHGKSIIASQVYPSFHLGKHPEHEIINVGYNLDLPTRFSRRVRDILQMPEYAAIFPDTKLDTKSQGVEAWLTTKRGGFTAAGRGGGITGKGAHVLIVDDPLKNMEEADNYDIREKLEDWYYSTAYTRLAPGGGVLIIECMTGETPVMMPDGSHRPLVDIRAGDEVATFHTGRLTTAVVRSHKQSGCDYVQKITTTSGRIVRANERHPFLVEHDTGELGWVRLKNLKLGQRIVTVKDNGGSIEVKPAQNVLSPQFAAGSAPATIINGSGLLDIALHQLIQNLKELRISNTATALQLKSMIISWLNRVGDVLFAENHLSTAILHTGRTSSPWTTATTPTRYELSCATTATSLLKSRSAPRFSKPLQNISDFTTETIVSIENDGYEPVYDLQIEGTENFIANGIVSHNTMWHDDDLAGRILSKMANDPDAEIFEVIRYPAISTKFEYRDYGTMEMVYSDEAVDNSELELLRAPGEPLHAERYPLEYLDRVRTSGMPARVWSALYQQDPVPEEGLCFTREMFHYSPTQPEKENKRYYIAWDFAISEKQRADYTVGVCLMQDEADNLFLVDLVRFQGGTQLITDQFVSMIVRWSGYSGSNVQLGVEDGQIWKAMKGILKQRMKEERAYVSIEVLQAITDKQSRASALQGRMEHGRFWFISGKPWNKDAERELQRFPAGRNDDIVDAISWAVRLATGKKPRRAPVAKKVKSWKDDLNKLVRHQTGGGYMSA